MYGTWGLRMTRTKAEDGWPTGDAIIRVIIYDKSNKAVIQMGSDTKLLTFVVPEHRK
jgi:hypothetical protein